MKKFSGRPFCFGMRQVLSLAAAATALCLTTTAFADEPPAAPEPTPVAEPTPAPEPVVEPTPAPVAEPAPAPVVEAAPAPVPAPFASMPRFESPSLGIAPQKDVTAAPPKEQPASTETVRVGGMLGVGFPRPFAVEGFVKIKRVVGIGAEYSFMPNATFMGTDVKFNGVAADLRVFPFKGAFFVGVRGGRQWLDAKTTVTLNGGALGSINESMAASTWFVNPRVGFLKTFDNGITVGIDAGVQIPISPSYERSSDTSRFGVDTGVDKALLTVANTLGNKTTPTVDLLRVGFLF